MAPPCHDTTCQGPKSRQRAPAGREKIALVAPVAPNNSYRLGGLGCLWLFAGPEVAIRLQLQVALEVPHLELYKHSCATHTSMYNHPWTSKQALPHHLAMPLREAAFSQTLMQAPQATASRRSIPKGQYYHT